LISSASSALSQKGESKCSSKNAHLQVSPERKGQEWGVCRDWDREPVKRIDVDKEEAKVKNALPLRGIIPGVELTRRIFPKA
jgi:hypothetical protein